VLTQRWPTRLIHSNIMETLKTKLELLAQEKTDSIQKVIAQEALNYTDPKRFFSDLFRNGCVSGMVSCLIWYSDTHAFFAKHYDEIEILREDYETMFGEPLKPKYDLMNWYAWFAFEETARQLADELELDN